MDNEYGVTSKGFVKKDYQTLFDDIESYLKGNDLFGADIDFSVNDPLYHICAPFVEVGTEIWETLEQIFYSASPKYAEGNNLSATGKYIGIVRKQASKAVGTARFTGTEGIAIPSNYQIGTKDSITFVTTTTATITNGYVDIPIIATDAGIRGNVPVGTITNIINPLIGLSSVTNTTETIKGQDEESDLDFRKRYLDSISISAIDIYASIKANVLKVTGVTNCNVTENDTNTVVNNIPPKSFLTMVNGGSDVDIAQAIFEKKPAGIQAYGNTLINISDSQGKIHAIGFSRAIQIPVWIKIKLTTNSNFIAGSNDTIKAAIEDSASKFNVGDDVAIFKLVTLIANLNLPGIDDILVTLSTDGTTYNTNNIVINDTSIAVSSSDKIEVS